MLVLRKQWILTNRRVKEAGCKRREHGGSNSGLKGTTEEYENH